MSKMSKVQAVYAARTLDDQRRAYANWAASYERELCQMGYRSPAVLAAVFTRFVSIDTTPILDAGCGGGLQAEPLALAGYTDIHGVDLSPEMLDIARSKSIYSSLGTAVLGETLPFETNAFGAVLSIGTITPNHAPPNCFDELIRVTRPSGWVVFSLRDDDTQDPRYQQAVDAHARAGRWTREFVTGLFACMPYGEPEVFHRLHVYRVT